MNTIQNNVVARLDLSKIMTHNSSKTNPPSRTIHVICYNNNPRFI